MIDEDLFDTSLAQDIKIEMEFDLALQQGNHEKCRTLIDKMAEINPDMSQSLKEELLESNVFHFKHEN